MAKSSKLVAAKRGKVLLVRRRSDGLWMFPGGRKRARESDKDCLRREIKEELPKLKRPPLPPGVAGGGHGGSHGYLMNEFVTAILKDRQPLVDIVMALNLTVSGIVAHSSALKNGELQKIPQYRI